MVSIFLDLPLSLGIGPKELTLLILSFIVSILSLDSLDDLSARSGKTQAKRISAGALPQCRLEQRFQPPR